MTLHLLQCVSRIFFYAFLAVFMLGWSYLLCYLDPDCRPFDGWMFGPAKEIMSDNETQLAPKDNEEGVK